MEVTNSIAYTHEKKIQGEKYLPKFMQLIGNRKKRMEEVGEDKISAVFPFHLLNERRLLPVTSMAGLVTALRSLGNYILRGPCLDCHCKIFLYFFILLYYLIVLPVADI